MGREVKRVALDFDWPLNMTTRIATRDELMAIEVGRALRFAQATLVTPGRSTHDAIQATVTVLADHSKRLASRFGPCWLEEARERGLLS